MRDEQVRLNEKWGLTGDRRFHLGVGIHTGRALLGNTGSHGNVEFSVAANSVDIAALIGSKNREYDTDVLVSESTIEAVRDEFGFDEVDDVQPNGVSDFIRLYSIRRFAAGS